MAMSSKSKNVQNKTYDRESIVKTAVPITQIFVSEQTDTVINLKFILKLSIVAILREF
jgi:hypothetical protein